MVSLKERIIENLGRLPEPMLREVLDFTESLAWRASDQKEPLLMVAGILSGEEISAKQIEWELYDAEE
ncbi:hypothetical protein H8E77_41015 [bacterium]|nr:hypothetical protein [bacterium]